MRQFFRGEIRTSASRNDGIDTVRSSGRGDQRSAAAGARTKQTDGESTCVVLSVEPAHRTDQSIRQQSNVEPNMPSVYVDLFLGGCEQIQ